jgi:transposase
MTMLADVTAPLTPPVADGADGADGAAGPGGPPAGPPVPLVAVHLDAVVGVDTHLDSHALVMVNPLGAVLASVGIGNDDAGFAQALAWIRRTAPGPRVVAGLEGTRSYGIGLARALQAAGLPVVEVARAHRRDRRRALRAAGKSDQLDAHRAAVTVLTLPADQVPTPRADGAREAARILLRARDQINHGRTQAINALRALLALGDASSHDEADRRLARAKNLPKKALTALTDPTTRLTPPAVTEPVGPARTGVQLQRRVRAGELARLAQAILAADRQLAQNKRDLVAVTRQAAASLLDIYGVGPVTAAQALVSWSHPARCRSEAAFAALAGANPIPASSGKTTRHRLNRGGDRQLNHALHTIAITRTRRCPRTRAYIQRRRAQGKTDKEIRRCLKRYIARELFRALTALDNT